MMSLGFGDRMSPLDLDCGEPARERAIDQTKTDFALGRITLPQLEANLDYLLDERRDDDEPDGYIGERPPAA